MKSSYIILFLLLGLTAVAHDRDTIIPTKEFTIHSTNKTIKVKLDQLSGYKVVYVGDLKILNHKGQFKNTIKDVKGVLLKDVMDSTFMNVSKAKDYSEYYIVFTASDNYKNVYSWNEIYNNDLGNHIFIITEKDGKKASETNDSILVMCLSDINTGRRHLKNLARIDIKRVD